MSFQKCPICDGSGNDPFITADILCQYPCPTCKGTRVISELTGDPPMIEIKHNLFESPVDSSLEEDLQFAETLIETIEEHGSNISSTKS